jgi:hypothetical protein
MILGACHIYFTDKPVFFIQTTKYEIKSWKITVRTSEDESTFVSVSTTKILFSHRIVFQHCSYTNWPFNSREKHRSFILSGREWELIRNKPLGTVASGVQQMFSCP